MGEKLLAQRLLRLLRASNGRSSRTATTLLDWARDERDWLWPDIVFADTDVVAAMSDGDPPAAGCDACAGERISWEGLPGLIEAIDAEEAAPSLFASVDAVSALLGFDPFEAELLRVAAAMDRLTRLASLRSRLSGGGEDMIALVGRLAGVDHGEASRRVRRSGPARFGLLYVGDGGGHGGGPDIEIDWRLVAVLDAQLTDPGELIDALAGLRQRAVLGPDDFAEQAEPLRLLVRLLKGAFARKAPGINILIHGPPGTGKTEFARMLAASAGASLYAVGEARSGDGEPSRGDRLTALKRSQRLLSRRAESVLLFDEMEDLFSDASIHVGRGDRQGASKIFINRLFEQNEVPTIWTSNAIDRVDPAHLRRMSYILRIGAPNRKARARIVARVAEAEGVAGAGDALDALLPATESAAGIARSALRAASLAGGGADDAEAVGASLILGLRGGRPLPPIVSGQIDLDLYEADCSIARLARRISAPGAPADVSLLLTGPPGTGKTALVSHLAERLDRPLVVKRASDLLSSWVGETEARIADAFAEARERGTVLLFDEADSLLFDRGDAQRSWEVSQVNELLTWMDSHPLPFFAATNHARRLDPAALRRFVFKIELGPLSPRLMARAWTRFFEGPAPAGLARISGLTPGDFAVVARQLRFGGAAGPADILALLEAESRAKPEPAERIGF
jgi:AAA+ superfamily predicted ATPase